MKTVVVNICLVLLLIISFSKKAFSQVLQNHTKITIDANGRKSTEKTVLIQVNDKTSNWLSHVEISHNPDQDFSFNYARIIDLNGNILRKVKKKDLKTRNDLSYQTFYQDNLITEFDLYWNKYPYQIEYSYTITEEAYLYVAYWTPYLYLNIPTIKSSLEINVPANYEIYINQTGDLSFKESKIEDRKIYYWKSNIVKKSKNEIYAPPIKELIPFVAVAPSKFKYGVYGSLDSWSSFGNWLNNLNEGTDQLPLNEKIIIDKLINGIVDKRDIIKKIYYYLQDHTNYINVSIDVGGLKSYPASYVCENKYGDCKALTTYMKSMLKSIGIESFYTVINAGINQEKIKTNFPSQQFNHVILAVPMKNDTIWLENTSNSLPFNYLGVNSQNRFALLVNAENSKLVKTPKLLLANILVEKNYNINVDEIKDWLSEITLILRGSSFESFRYSMLNETESDQINKILKYVDIDGFDIDNWKIVDSHRDSTHIKINLTGRFPNPTRKFGNKEVINPLKILIPNFEKPSNRKLDVRINFPINKSNQVVYKFKNLENKKINLPEGISIKTVFGEYSTEYIISNDLIICNENFTLFDNNIPIKNYPEFYSFIQSIINHKKKSAILLE